MDISQAVSESRIKNPCRSYADLARELGISKQRVHQIVVRLQLPRKLKLKDRFKDRFSCSECGQSRPNAKKAGYCTSCRHEKSIVPVSCSFCGKLFSMSKSQLLGRVKRYKGLHCSQRCNKLHYFYGTPDNIPPRVSLLKKCVVCEAEFWPPQQVCKANPGRETCSSRCWHKLIILRQVT